MMFQVVDIMRVNVDKVLERDQKLTELDDRAGECCIFSEIGLVFNLKQSLNKASEERSFFFDTPL